MYLQKVLTGLLALAISCIYLVATIYLVNTPWDNKPKTFCISFARGYGFLYMLYFALVTLTCVYFGYHTAIMGVIAFFGIIVSVILLTMIEREYQTWTRVIAISGIPILVKLSHSTYFVVDVLLAEPVTIQWNLFLYLMVSVVFELILLLFWTLFPILSVVSDAYPVCNIHTEVILCGNENLQIRVM